MDVSFIPLSFTYLLLMIKAAITPGIQPRIVRIMTSRIEPHPLSITARGGKMIHKMTRHMDIV
jgi:hypothetical protein